MPATPKFGLRYPASTDPADVPSDLLKLATDVETALGPGTAPPVGIVAGECQVWNGTTWARSTVQRLGIGSLAGYPADGTKFLAGDGTWKVVPLTPAGVINQYAGAAAPSGWLLCDGSPVSRSTYAALFSAIGTTYGAGDGSTTFNLPDLRGRVLIGKAASGTFATLGATGGAETHAIALTELPAHDHGGSVSATSGGTPAGTVASSFTGNALPNHSHASTATFAGNALGGHAHTFAGAALPDHVHYMTDGIPDMSYISHAHARDGSTLAVVDIGGRNGASYDGGYNIPTTTPNSPATGHPPMTLTPAGSISSVSAGTPSGTVTLSNHADSAGTPSGTVASTFTGSALPTHSHTISAQGGGTAMSLLNPYAVLNHIIKT
jgi:microcystin-dependent protein